MHAENGIVINEIIKHALAKGHTAPKYHALTRPTIAEAEGVHRAIAIAEMAESPVYIVHLSCADALNQVRQARDRGIPAFAEPCPQYLFLSLDNYDEPGFDGAKYVMTPPLRDKSNQAELWKGLKTDDLQVISTDHCPFCMKEQKELGLNDFTKIPNGAPGVENRVSLIYNGGRAIRDFCEVVQPELLLLFHAEGTVIRGDNLQIVRLQTLPKLCLIRLVTQWWRHHILRTIKPRLIVIVERKEEILGTSLGECRYSAIACLANLIERVGTR